MSDRVVSYIFFANIRLAINSTRARWSIRYTNLFKFLLLIDKSLLSRASLHVTRLITLEKRDSPCVFRKRNGFLFVSNNVIVVSTAKVFSVEGLTDFTWNVITRLTFRRFSIRYFTSTSRSAQYFFSWNFLRIFFFF